MTTSPDILRRESRLPASPAAAAVLLEPALAEAAGADAAPVSLTLDYGAQVPGGAAVVVEAWIDRATRTLVFAHGRLLAADGATLLASGSAVFRRGSPPAPKP
ncbi:MAG: PaaI family thioesterase [Phenylobacterium sp.]|uniref:PaaI family thioesterase n=1 Tax=Phenylobacterium sp. TaxID=1871053 RepID=UPI00391BE141